MASQMIARTAASETAVLSSCLHRPARLTGAPCLCHAMRALWPIVTCTIHLCIDLLGWMRCCLTFPCQPDRPPFCTDLCTISVTSE